MKRPYEKPVIMKLQSSFMNKFGMTSSLHRRVRTAIEGVKIGELTERFGSPLFVFSERKIRRQYRQLYSAFSTRYPDVQFGWSYKTNYLQAVCAIMHQEGAIAEIVSKMEYDKAKALGVPGEKILFNGPYKPLETLESAIADNVQINVDHMDEIEDLEVIANKLGRTIKVGLRLNLDAGISPQWSRFGFNLESGQAADAVNRIKRGSRLAINGLHCHIGTYILDPGAYARMIEKMVEFGYEIEAELDTQIEYFDIGGGFPSHCRLKGSYLSPDVSIPPVDDYAERICNALLDSLRSQHRPRLIVESGRGIIDEAGYLITSIIASKRLADGTRAYVADAGVNLLYTAFWYKFNVETDREIDGMRETSVVYGPMCMNIDVIDEGVELPPLQRGHRLIVSPVGAYNLTQSMQFIEYRPNVVLIGEEGTVDIIREAEDLSDVQRREVLPDRLAQDSSEN